jgi:hypothetical protein
MPDEKLATLPTRDTVRVEYDEEFSPEGKLATISPDELLSDIRGLMGPSTREQVTKLSLAFRQRMREADKEGAEMLERESALKGQNDQLRAQNARLAAERDEWRAKHDPSGEVATLREELAKATARADGAEKLVEQHMARIQKLKLPKKARGKRK